MKNQKYTGEHSNPLKSILDSKFTQGDYTVYRAHLRLPLPYLKILFRNYSRPFEMVEALPKVLEKYHSHLLEKYKMSVEPEIEKKLWEVARIPFPFYKEIPVECEKSGDQEDFEFLKTRVKQMVDNGTQLYLHSSQMDSAMHAGVSLVKQAIKEKVFRPCCISFPQLVEDKKEAFNGGIVTLSTYADTSELLLLYAVGSEFSGSGYTASVLTNLLGQRAYENKATVVVSGLAPTDFQLRYGKAPEGVCIGFKDVKIKETLKNLRKALERV